MISKECQLFLQHLQPGAPLMSTRGYSWRGGDSSQWPWCVSLALSWGGKGVRRSGSIFGYNWVLEYSPNDILGFVIFIFNQKVYNSGYRYYIVSEVGFFVNMDRRFRISILDSYLKKRNKCNSAGNWGKLCGGRRERKKEKILRLSSWVKQKQISNY